MKNNKSFYSLALFCALNAGMVTQAQAGMGSFVVGYALGSSGSGGSAPSKPEPTSSDMLACFVAMKTREGDTALVNLTNVKYIKYSEGRVVFNDASVIEVKPFANPRNPAEYLPPNVPTQPKGWDSSMNCGKGEASNFINLEYFNHRAAFRSSDINAISSQTTGRDFNITVMLTGNFNSWTAPASIEKVSPWYRSEAQFDHMKREEVTQVLQAQRQDMKQQTIRFMALLHQSLLDSGLAWKPEAPKAAEPIGDSTAQHNGAARRKP